MSTDTFGVAVIDAVTVNRGDAVAQEASGAARHDLRPAP